jgi:hypothetical protein
VPTLTRDRRSDMQSQTPTLDRIDSLIKDVELPKFDLPKFDLSKVEMPKFERPTPDDVGKAAAAAAATIGLAKARPRRWPYLVVAGAAIATAGWVAMNWSTIRARIDMLTAKAKQRMTAVQGEETWDDAVAFTAAETKAIEPSLDTVTPTSPTLDDYPNGLGTEREPIGSSRS